MASGVEYRGSGSDQGLPGYQVRTSVNQVRTSGYQVRTSVNQVRTSSYQVRTSGSGAPIGVRMVPDRAEINMLGVNQEPKSDVKGYCSR